MRLQVPSNKNSFGIQRFHRRVIADPHTYTRHNQIVSNVVQGGKCPFECDFPTILQVPKLQNETKAEAASRIEEHRVKDVILFQGSIYSKTVLLQYTRTRGAHLGTTGFFQNPTRNGQRFTLADVEKAPSTLSGKDLLEYAMRSTGEDANATIFRHEVKRIILANDLGVTLEEDKEYTLLWYVSQLEKASTHVEDAAAAFHNHLQKNPNRSTRVLGAGKMMWELVSSLLYHALILFLPSIVVSKLLLRDSKRGLEEVVEDALAAKEELASKNKELERNQEQIRELQRYHGKNESIIAGMKATIERLERTQEKLRQDRDKYRNVVHRVENVTRIHQTYMDSFYNFATEAAHLQTELERLKQEGNTMYFNRKESS